MSHVLNPIEVVTGLEELTARFEGWPSFHDAEVVSARLDRHGSDQWEGPILEVDIHLFKGRHRDSTPARFEWYDHTVVTLRFALVMQLELCEFNSQNALFDLCFERPPHAPSIAPIQVTFESSFGMSATFYCAAVAVAKVECKLPSGSVYA